jgi:hypothetical protein
MRSRLYAAAKGCLRFLSAVARPHDRVRDGRKASDWWLKADRRNSAVAGVVLLCGELGRTLAARHHGNRALLGTACLQELIGAIFLILVDRWAVWRAGVRWSPDRAWAFTLGTIGDRAPLGEWPGLPGGAPVLPIRAGI